jgi:hypothetical protein
VSASDRVGVVTPQREPLIVEVPTVLTRIAAQLKAQETEVDVAEPTAEAEPAANTAQIAR